MIGDPLIILIPPMEFPSSPESEIIKTTPGFHEMELPEKGSNEDVPFYGEFLNCIGTTFGFMRTWMPCICCFVPYPYITIEQGSEGIFSKFGNPLLIQDGTNRQCSPVCTT